MAELNLSEREQELLKLVATGASNKEISQKLYISVNTVKVHLRNIFTKLEVASRTEAAMWAVQNGLVDAGLADGVGIPGGSPEVDRAQSWFIQMSPLGRFGIMVGIALLLVVIGFGVSLLFRPTPAPFSLEDAALISDFEESRWQELADMPTARAGLAAAAYDNQIYAIAGEGSDGVLNVNERYDPPTDSWETLAPKPLAVNDMHAGVIGGKIYVPGGSLSSGDVTNALEIYDPRVDKWSQGAPLPVGLSAYALATFEGRMYIFGGWDGEKYQDSVYMYDPVMDTWTERTPMPTARGFSGAAEAGSKIYVIGGWDGEEALAVNEAYSPTEDGSGENPWSPQAELPVPFIRGVVTSIAGSVYGIDSSETPLTLLEFSIPEQGWRVHQLPDQFSRDWQQVELLSLNTQLYMIGGKLNDQPIRRSIAYQAIYTIVLPILQTND